MQTQQTQIVGNQVLNLHIELATMQSVQILLAYWVLSDVDARILVRGFENLRQV